MQSLKGANAIAKVEAKPSRQFVAKPSRQFVAAPSVVKPLRDGAAKLGSESPQPYRFDAGTALGGVGIYDVV
jgi:hypothetical protein